MRGRAGLLGRRAILRGAGGAAVALPALEAMRPLHAAEAAARNFVGFFTPNGHRDWNPAPAPAAFALPAVFAPLSVHRGSIVIVQGLSMKASATEGADGIATALTGTKPGEGRSLDQELARAFLGRTRMASLELGVNVKAMPPLRGALSYAGKGQPRPPTSDPSVVFQALFRRPQGNDALVLSRRASVLDGIKANLQRTEAQVSGADRVRIAAHLQEIRDLETRLTVIPGPVCDPPPALPPLDLVEHDNAGKILDLQLGLLAVAFACDQVRTATVMAAEAGAERYFRFLGLPGESRSDSWVGLARRTDANAVAAQRTISSFYAKSLSAFATRLKENVDPQTGKSILDRSTILWCTDCNPDRSHADVPFVLIGNAGGAWSGGRGLRVPAGTPHNDLLVSVLEAMGVPTKVFGDPKYSNGALVGLR